MRKNLIFLFILLLMPPVQGATIQGTVYDWFNMEPLGDVIIEVNSTPPQQVVAKDGSYSLILPVGDYHITAKYYRYGVLEYYAEENITVAGDGNFVLDLIMLPALEEERLVPPETLELDELITENQSRKQSMYPVAIFTIIAVIIFFFLKQGKKEKVVQEAEELPGDLAQVLEIIRARGGRVTQTELRKKLPYSEAKISLMLTDLESRGMIKKIKKGRGNIIVLVQQAKR